MVDEKTQASEALLHNFLPDAVAQRVLQGEDQVVDDVQQATILVAQLVGIGRLNSEREAEATAKVLDALVIAFDEASIRHGVERQRTVNEYYIAVCGVTVPCIDHAKRTVGFGQEMLTIVKRLNEQYDTELALRMASTQVS